MVNEGYASGVGKSVEDLIGKNDIEIGFPEELVFGNPDKGITGFRNDDKRALKGETIHNEYDPAIAADGTLHIFDTYKISLRDNNGNIYAVLGYAHDITERKQAEQAIQESENRFKELFNHMSSGVAVYEAKDNSKDFIIKDFNRAAEKMEKVKKEDIIGKSVLKTFPGVKDFGLFKVFQEVYKTGKPQHHPITFYKDQRIDGWRENHVYKLPSGEVVAVYNDITEHKQAEKQIKDSEEYLKTLFDYAPDAYYISDLKGNFIDGNKAAEKLMSYKKEELIGKNFLRLKLLSLADIPKAAKLLAKNLRRLPTGPDEFVLNRKDNSKVIVEISTYPVKIKGRSLALGIARDITERKQAEEETRQKTEDMALINSLNDVVNRGNTLLEILQLLARETKRIFSCHGATAYLVSEDREYLVMQIFTRPPAMIRRIEKLIGMRIPAISIPLKAGSLYQKMLQEDKPQLINDPKIIQGLMAEFTENKILKKLVPKIYSILDTRSVINVPLVSEGKAIGLLDISRKEPFTEFDLKRFETISGQLTSIIERKQAEENLENIKDELEMLLDSVPAIIYYKDKGGKIIRANKALADSLKVPIKDIIGKTTEELFPKEQAENMRKDDKEIIIFGKPKKNIIQPYTTPDGIRWLTTDKIPYKDKGGKITGVIGLAKDITVQRKSEEELKQSYQRLKKTMDASIETMSRILEAKDPYTSGHQHRVCQLAVPLARELGLPEDKIEGIRIASLIHDIGKIGLPTEILSKPSKLTDIEFSLIKGHSQIGYDILKSIDFSYPIAQIVLQHHERLNGSGYPQGFKGEDMLLEAKIIGVADVVEAMSSFRPYRPALGIDKALEEITKNKGILYEQKVVNACLKLFKEKGFKFE